ncbi:DUF4249 domain-containing protein [Limibacter armeniacum]|uniref:DUF4249 domain-containing protein n=1 Tax=Limibacter armeniacum TaxID=466084 RepID=UPI002FE6A0F2
MNYISKTKSLKRSYVGVLLLLILSLTSCDENFMTRDVDPNLLPEFESKVAVFGVISPQLPTIDISLSSNVPIIGTQRDMHYGEKKVITDATVKISDGIDEVILPYDSDMLLYSILQESFPIVEGNTYTVNITTQGGLQLTAKCTVPKANPIAEMELEQKADFYSIRVIWNDKSGEENYYRVGAWVGELYDDGITQTTYWNESYFDQYLFSDTNRDGEMLRAQSEYYGYKETNSPLKAKLLTVDRNYYLYHKDLEYYWEVDDNPFAEPKNIYTNIEGDGIGMFGAFSETELNSNN